MPIPLGSLLRLKHDFSEIEFISKYREISGATAGGWRWGEDERKHRYFQKERLTLWAG